MIELKQGAIYKSTSGRVKYDGIDSFCGEQTFRFKRLDRTGTDYVLPSEIEKFICIDDKEKTYEELAAMNEELLAALEDMLKVSVMDVVSSDDFWSAFNKANELLAKAKAKS